MLPTAPRASTSLTDVVAGTLVLNAHAFPNKASSLPTRSPVCPDLATDYTPKASSPQRRPSAECRLFAQAAPAVRTQSARHLFKTVAAHRQQSIKGQVSVPQETSPQVTDLAHY